VRACSSSHNSNSNNSVVLMLMIDDCLFFVLVFGDAHQEPSTAAVLTPHDPHNNNLYKFFFARAGYTIITIKFEINFLHYKFY